MDVTVIRLNDCLAMIDAYGSKGWSTFATPSLMMVALLANCGKNVSFLAWTRTLLFQARDGYAFIIPCVDHDLQAACLQIRRLDLTARDCAEPGCEMFRMLSEASDACVDDLQSQALFMLKDQLDEEREKQPPEWWHGKESVLVWQQSGYVQKDLITRSATLITHDGYAMCPVITNCIGPTSKLVPMPN